MSNSNEINTVNELVAKGPIPAFTGKPDSLSAEGPMVESKGPVEVTASAIAHYAEPIPAPMSPAELAKAALKAAVKAKMDEAKEAAMIKLYNNDAFQDSLVKQAMREETTDLINNLNSQCEQIVIDIEVYSKVLRKARTWNPSRVYGYGHTLSTLFGVLSGIQYSVAEHKSSMLIATGFSEDAVERTLTALGQLPYYSTKNSVLVEGTPTNVPELLECLTLLEYQMGVKVDTALVTTKVAERLFYVAQVKAEATEAETAAGLDMMNAIIQ
jgi:cell division protein FtsI/penicillin-binding protein 2